jgi:parallel beta-helix repeat protein
MLDIKKLHTAVVCLLLLWLGLSGCQNSAPPSSPVVVAEIPVQSGACVESLLAEAPDGATVTLPCARYLLSRPLVLGRAVNLTGEPGAILELLPGANTSLIEIRPACPESEVVGVRLSDLTLIGNRDRQCAGSGVTILRASRCELRRLDISGMWLDGVYCSDVRESLFDDLVLHDCGRNGVSFGEAIREGLNEANTLRRCRAVDNGLMGIDLEPGIENSLFDCLATGNGSHGLSLGAGSRTHGNRILTCTADDNGGNGINIWSDANTVISCKASGNQADGISLIGPEATGNELRSCTSGRNGRHGIGLDRTNSTLISGCSSSDNGRSGLGDGIAVVAGCPVYDNRLVANQVSGASHRYALVITEQVRRTVCLENRFSGTLSVSAPDVVWE